jgi:hypothetical protein
MQGNDFVLSSTRYQWQWVLWSWWSGNGLGPFRYSTWAGFLEGLGLGTEFSGEFSFEKRTEIGSLLRINRTTVHSFHLLLYRNNKHSFRRNKRKRRRTVLVRSLSLTNPGWSQEPDLIDAFTQCCCVPRASQILLLLQCINPSTSESVTSKPRSASSVYWASCRDARIL